MPRIRSIKPELWLSPQVMNLSLAARLLFVGLITQADDDGRGIADPRKLKAAVFPGDDEITSVRVLELLAENESQGLCITYDANGHGRVYALPTWREHQYVERPKKSHYPAPPGGIAPEHSRNETGEITEGAVMNPRGSDLIGRDRKGSDPDARARVSGSHPVDNFSKRTPAKNGLQNGRIAETDETRRRRAEAAALVEKLAATGAKP